MSVGDECTRCQAPLRTLAAFCNKCGQLVDRQTQVVVPDLLHRIAARQRTLLRFFFALIVLQIAAFLPIWQTYSMMGFAVLCAYLLTFVLVMVCVLSLANALEYGWFNSTWLTLLCLVPVVNWVVVVMLSHWATIELRDAGIRVGFLGATRRDVDRMTSANRCRTCGYDLRGLTSSRCPECGVAFTPAVVGLPIKSTAPFGLREP